MAEAARAAEQHESLKRVIWELRAALEERHQLAAVQVLTAGLVLHSKRLVLPLRRRTACLENDSTAA